VTGMGRVYSGHVSKVDYFRNTIYFNKVLTLSNADYIRISESISINAKKNITFEAYAPIINGDYENNIKRELTFNLLQLKGQLDIGNMNVILKISDDDFCGTKSSCIKWSIK
ncbi:TPA: hypothetical protein ACIPBB_004950, partial [Salmonella enterica subsp. diarizonae serovar 61:l,v:z35]